MNVLQTVLPCILSRCLLCVICLSIIPVAAYAQYENVWVFGKNSGVDFNGGTPTAITTNIGTTDVAGECSASVCDENGQLLFYTEGTRVLDRQHNLMPNGNNLTPVQSTNYLTPTSSTSQGSIIIPRPGHPGQYYIFSLTSREIGNNGSGRLFYSVVDMSLNGGLGDVVSGAKGIPVDTNLMEGMTAVAGNGCNIWLLVISRTKECKAFEITTTGISAPVTSLVQNIYNSVYMSGCIGVSNDRRKIAITESCSVPYNPGLLLFDFDPATGMLSNEQELYPYAIGYGVCFSPDDTKLYFSSALGVIQYNLAAGSLTNIIASQTTVSPVSLTHLKLAPDNKIYFRNNELSLSVINDPNQAGLACQPQANAVTLTDTMHIGLPSVVPLMIVPDTLHSVREIVTCVSPFTLTAGDTTGWGYVWNDGTDGKTLTINAPGTYWVKYTTSNPCVFHTDTIKYSLGALIPSHVAAVICANESFLFNGRLLYSAGVYYDTLITAEGCDSVVTLELTVLPPPVLNDAIQQIICAGEVYFFNGRELRNPGVYYDTFPDANGCDSVIILELIVEPLPEVDITTVQTGAALCLGDTVSCIAGGAVQYQWYNNGRLAGYTNPVGIYLSDHYTNVLVIGLSEHDCRDSASTVIHAAVCCTLLIPDAFTPNGDGLNDYLRPQSNDNIEKVHLQVFNRLGQNVFTADRISTHWDGSYKGMPADVGVYYYSISATCPDGTEITRKGDITLIR